MVRKTWVERHRPAQGQGHRPRFLGPRHASVQLGDIFSVLTAGEWFNSPAALEHYGLQPFNAQALYRAVELQGRRREGIHGASERDPEALRPALDGHGHGIDLAGVLRRRAGAGHVQLLAKSLAGQAPADAGRGSAGASPEHSYWHDGGGWQRK